MNEVSEEIYNILSTSLLSLREMTEEECKNLEESLCFTRDSVKDSVLTNGSNRLCFLDCDLFDWYVQQVELKGDLAIHEIFFYEGMGYWIKCVDVTEN